MIYQKFASVYDNLMIDTPYEKWLEHLLDIINKYNPKIKTILDLACGTGAMSNRLAFKGYNVLGVDISSEMLEAAQNKAYNNNLKINYINQDIKKLELLDTYDCIISFCDGFNYITDKKDLFKIFQNINNYLNDGGLFIYDISSEYKLENILGNNIFSDTDEDITFIWENYYDKNNRILEFDLSVFTKVGEFYKRENESHIQKSYSVIELIEMMEKSNFEILEILDTNTNLKINEKSERIMVVGRKK